MVVRYYCPTCVKISRVADITQRCKECGDGIKKIDVKHEGFEMMKKMIIPLGFIITFPALLIFIGYILNFEMIMDYMYLVITIYVIILVSFILVFTIIAQVLHKQIDEKGLSMATGDLIMHGHKMRPDYLED